jgi:hypothetical protein
MNGYNQQMWNKLDQLERRLDRIIRLLAILADDHCTCGLPSSDYCKVHERRKQ